MEYYKTILEDIRCEEIPAQFPEKLQPRNDGLVFLGGKITVNTVVEAYTRGIFPWAGLDPIPWYSPQPRLVLYPSELHLFRSLRYFIRNTSLTVSFDKNFTRVMKQCAHVERPFQTGTWINGDMPAVYTELHHLHIAHSVEVYDGDELCGGLYGLTFGRAFFGESMFHQRPNASKLALYTLCRLLIQLEFDFIDCQAVTDHMLHFGGKPIPRKKYLRILAETLHKESMHTSWQDFGKLL
jgi:leucyl/phenylalanyl-tRNA--protein transferase